jgi:hypothetical protein
MKNEPVRWGEISSCARWILVKWGKIFDMKALSHPTEMDIFGRFWLIIWYSTAQLENTTKIVIQGAVCLITTKDISEIPCLHNFVPPRRDIWWDKNSHVNTEIIHPTQVSFSANRGLIWAGFQLPKPALKIIYLPYVVMYRPIRSFDCASKWRVLRWKQIAVELWHVTGRFRICISKYSTVQTSFVFYLQATIGLQIKSFLY